ncbi:LacI family transcriptional regulator [Miniimonas arenae]|uniref:LacI family transcriptional regulator n=1 Tax=Miniimonas arenae TaxID=676201 RepID=A0A5C5BCS3_9MICO|nr:LacI family DNA-binding transcriptional regulator [Miniimonas arenae]TNU74051.1 LacI family transcriptional regulator [Miniimonas arenae]
MTADSVTTAAPTPARHRPSVMDVARLARVSVGTVSNVLNRPERVSPRTRSRVESAIAELEFVPSESARQLRAGRARSVGAIVLDVGNPFFTALTRGVEDRIGADGLALLVSSSDDDPERENRALQLYEQHGVRGVLVTPASAERADLHALRARGTTVVLMDVDGEDELPSVSVDDVLGASLPVAHLLELGHRRIALFNGPLTIHQCADRLAGARLAVVNAGLDPDEVLVEMPLPSLNAEHGTLAAERLLALPESTRPTAIFCVNDLVALGALSTLVRAGVPVPDGVAVVGYDDVPWAAMLVVPLTTVRQPTHEIGWTAADLLLRLDGEDAVGPTRVRFAPELVVRRSSDPGA